MKKILPLLIILVLFVTACGGNKEAEKKEVKKDDGKILQDDGMLNFKNMLNTKGTVVYLLSNKDDDNSGQPNSKSRIDAMMINEKDGKVRVYNTGYDTPTSLWLGQLDDSDDEQIVEVANKADKAFIEEQIKYAKNTMEAKKEKLVTPDNQMPSDLQVEYDSAMNLKYRQPVLKDIIYGTEKREKGTSLYLNIEPHQIKHGTKYSLVDNIKSSFYVMKPTPVMEIGKKKYIGYVSQEYGTTGDGEVVMIVVEAPKGTKGITSGLEQ